MIGPRQSRYYFDVDGSDENYNFADSVGTLLPNDNAALDHADGVIRELKAAGGYDDRILHMVVKDENGDIVFAIPFQNPDLA
jgi:hypothetical protein